MDIYNQILPDRYCRTCLVELEDLESRRKHFVSPEVAYKLFTCTSISTSSDDGRYSKHLCENCYNQLNEFDSFRQMCIDSQHSLHEIFLKSKNVENSDDGTRNECRKSSGIFKTTDDTNETKNEPEIAHERGKRAGYHQRLRLKRIKTDPETIEYIQINDNPEERAIIQGNRSKSIKKKSLNNDSIQIKAEPEGSVHKARKSNGACRLKRIKKASEYEQQQEYSGKNQNSSKSFQCEMCSKRFLAEHRYTAHKRTHDGLIPYPCPRENCEKGFGRYSSLSAHLKQHDGTNRWFTCNEENCTRQYKHKATLDVHLRRFHKKGPELESCVCEVCGKLFNSSAILSEHRFTHIDKSELPFACSYQPQCKYRSSNRTNLKIHMMRHAGIKKHVCPHCGMRKTTRNELNIHINYHTLERRFPCRFCSKICNNAGNLKVHIRTIHERAKDYGCRYCERTFAKPDTRKYHEMIHTGEKPHECSDCGKRFVQPAALRAHKKIHLRQKANCDK